MGGWQDYTGVGVVGLNKGPFSLSLKAHSGLKDDWFIQYKQTNKQIKAGGAEHL